MQDKVDPAYLRSRAEHYRIEAEGETDPKRADLFRQLAEAFDNDAGEREQRRASSKR